MGGCRSKKSFRATAGVAVLAMVGGLVAALATTVAPASAFGYASACAAASDTAFTPPAGDAANCLKLYELSLGKDDGSFGENDSLIRSQFGSFATRFLTLASIAHTDREPFPDVTPATVPNAAVLQDIEEGHAAGVVNGFADGTFGPGLNMTVKQAATILINLAKAIHDANPAAPDLRPELDGNGNPDTTKTYDYAIDHEILDVNAKNLGGALYPSGKDDTVQRGLFADMLAQLLQQEVDAGVVADRSATNQAFSASPSGETLRQFTSAPGVAPTTGGSQDIVFGAGAGATAAAPMSLNGATVDVALFDCGLGDHAAVRLNGSVASFRDHDPAGKPDFTADNFGTVTGKAVLVSLNGDPVTGQQSNGYTVAGDTLTVRVNATGADCAFVVVWVDSTAGDKLNLTPVTFGTTAGTGYRQPSEPFAAAGPVVWHYGEAPSATVIDDSVIYVNAASKFFVGGTSGFRFNWGRANDRYFYTAAGPTNVELDEAGWTEALSVLDSIKGFTGLAYQRSGPNSFLNDVDFSDAPSGSTGAVGDFDASAADTTSNDVKVTVDTADPGGFIDYYIIFVFTSTGSFVTSADSMATHSNVVVAPDLAAGDYLVSAIAVTKRGAGSVFFGEPVALTVTAPPVGAKAGAPLSTAVALLDDDSSASVTTADRISVTFDEKMDPPSAGDKFTVMDADGTVASIENGLNATFSLDAAGNHLTITMTSGPSISVAGGTAGVQSPATVQSSTGNTDLDEHVEWDVAGSSDFTL